jgi:hypothetical protein
MNNLQSLNIFMLSKQVTLGPLKQCSAQSFKILTLIEKSKVSAS